MGSPENPTPDYPPIGSPAPSPSQTAQSARSQVIEPSPALKSRQLRQYGPKTVQGIMAFLALLITVVTGVAYATVGGLTTDLASAGNLNLGGSATEQKKDGATDILLVGVDSRTDAKGNPLSQSEIDMLHAGDDQGATNTDTIILIRVPNDGSSTTAISIPRDSYISTSALGKTKINGVYGQTKFAKEEELANSGVTDQAEVEKKSTEAGRQALISAVADLTGVTVDHYAEVGLLGFVLLTNAVGGVQVCLNDAVNDSFSGANFPAGVQTLNGAQGLAFVRQRHGLPRGDLDRIARQQAYMASLAGSVLSAGTLSNPSTLSKMTEAVERSVVIDSDWDLMGFITHLQNMAGGNVSFRTIPVTNIDGVGDYGESVVEVDKSAVREFVSSVLGSKDGHAPSSASEPVTKDFTASDFSVSVMNATDTAGMATRVAQVVQAEGFATGEVGNGSSNESSTVVYAKDPQAMPARYLAQLMGNVAVEEDKGLADNSFRLVLGSDFKGPGATQSSLANYLSKNPGSAGAVQAGAGQAESGQAAGPTDEAASPTFTAEGGPKCVN